MEKEKFDELMTATDVLYRMVWRNPSSGYIKDGKEYVSANIIEDKEDIIESLAVVTDFVNKVIKQNENRRSN